jgi:hypothetical protein
VSTETVEAQLYNWFYCCNTTSNPNCPTSALDPLQRAVSRGRAVFRRLLLWLCMRACSCWDFPSSCWQEATAWCRPRRCAWSARRLYVWVSAHRLSYVSLRRRLRGGQALHPAVNVD